MNKFFNIEREIMGDNKKRILEVYGKRLQQSKKAKENIKHAVKFLPQIEKEIEITESHIKIIELMPDSIDFPEDLVDVAENEYREFETIYGPLIKSKLDYQPYQAPLISGMSSSMAYIDKTSQEYGNYKVSQDWVLPAKLIYNDLHRKHNRQKETSNLIGKLKPELQVYFAKAMDDLSKVKNEITQINDLAFRYRTILEKLKGELNVSLLKGIQAKDNKIFLKMAELRTDGPGNPDNQLFIEEIKKYDELHSIFSNIGKWNSSPTFDDFESLVIRFIDNIFAMLTILSRHNAGIF
jgi:hypothetical protein